MTRIAVCDDDAIFLERVEQLLKKYAKENDQTFGLTCLQNPQTLWDEVNDGTIFDIFILDIEMPELDGLKLAERIRQASPNAPILFFTSHVELSREGYKVEALRFVSKVSMESELPEALDAAL